jgi:uncharacterized protein YacL (UPF0231 family)
MTTLRDRALGRIAVAQHFLQEIKDNLDATVAHFLETDEDTTGKERRELLEQAEFGAHMIAMAVGEAATALGDMGEELLEEGENLGEDETPVDEDDEE